MANYEVLLRNPDNTFSGQLVNFSSFELVKRHNAIGKWTIRGEGKRPISDGQGIVIRRNGIAIFGGLMRSHSSNAKNESGKYTRSWEVSGIDDLGKLSERILVPNPVTMVYTDDSHDERSGTAETVILDYAKYNFGQFAIPMRRIPYFYVADSLGRGSAVSEKARFVYALTFLGDIANRSGLGLQITYDGSGNQVLGVYVPVDRSASVKFSLDLGTLSSFTKNGAAPEANCNFFLGQGQAEARTIVSSRDDASILKWGLIEGVKDQRNVNSATTLKSLSEAALQTTAAKDGFSIAPIEGDFCGFRFGVDYNLGDTVSFSDDGEIITDVIREFTIELDSNGNEKFKPSIGEKANANNPVSSIVNQMKSISSRVDNLEVSE